MSALSFWTTTYQIHILQKLHRNDNIKGTSADHIPKQVSDDAINVILIGAGLPKAASIVTPKVTARYHSIFLIKVPPNEKSTHTSLVLRVSAIIFPQ